MSLHRSLKTKSGALEAHRSVLSRAERLARLKTEGRWSDDKTSPLHLPKVRNIKIATKKKKAEGEAVEGAEGAVAGVPGAAGTVAPATGAAGAKGATAGAKGAAAVGAKGTAAPAAKPAAGGKGEKPAGKPKK